MKMAVKHVGAAAVLMVVPSYLVDTELEMKIYEVFTISPTWASVWLKAPTSSFTF